MDTTTDTIPTSRAEPAHFCGLRLEFLEPVFNHHELVAHQSPEAGSSKTVGHRVPQHTTGSDRPQIPRQESGFCSELLCSSEPDARR